MKLFAEALSLWQGPVATGIGAEVRAHAAFGLLSREYVTAVREAADAALLAGLPGTVLPALRRAAAEHPLDEPLLSRLILTLAADTRRAEALSTYRRPVPGSPVSWASSSSSRRAHRRCCWTTRHGLRATDEVLDGWWSERCAAPRSR